MRTRVPRAGTGSARMPWWGHVLVLTLIIGSTSVSVVTGQPLYAWVGVPFAWFLSVVIVTPAWRAAAARIAQNRYVWLGVAGMAFATFAATVATVVTG